MSPEIALVLGLLAAVACIILLYIKVLPQKLDGNFSSKFLQGLHNYFHFKRLYIEDILKFVFILLTVCCITIGFFMLFASYQGYYYSQSFFLYGLLLMVAGPVALRISYELVMMTILLVQNVIDINKKMDKILRKDVQAPVAKEAAPVVKDPMPFVENSTTQE